LNAELVLMDDYSFPTAYVLLLAWG